MKRATRFKDGIWTPLDGEIMDVLELIYTVLVTWAFFAGMYYLLVTFLENSKKADRSKECPYCSDHMVKYDFRYKT